MMEAEAESEAIRIRGEAEAFAIEAKAKAEAEQMQKEADAWKEYREAAMVNMLLETLPKVNYKALSRSSGLPASLFCHSILLLKSLSFLVTFS